MAKSKPQSKTIILAIPLGLYRRFKRSKLRRDCATDAEAIRGAIRSTISKGGSQDETAASHSAA